jgi:hypothetical protein
MTRSGAALLAAGSGFACRGAADCWEQEASARHAAGKIMKFAIKLVAEGNRLGTGLLLKP